MRRTLPLFLLGALPCLLLALYTDHRWEDWYITFRASKNLALGHGLVYQPGEVLQTFTSPFNVLFPALFSWLTGNQHDDLVLWLYRLLGAALLGGSVLLLDRLARQQQWAQPARWLLLGGVVLDGKIADFSINGQEAAFLVFFLSLTLLALVEGRSRLLGIAWAGLMGSRPDAFVWIGATALGWLLALPRDQRLPALRRCLRALPWTLLLYGPWFAWTWWYYGTPVPHSALAKALHSPQPEPLQLASDLLLFPVHSLFTLQPVAWDTLFMPPDYFFGGWPNLLILASRLLGLVASYAWLLPGAPRLLRTASLATLLGSFYFQEFFHRPYACWYFPPCTLLALVSLAGLLHHRWQRAPVHHRRQRLLAAALLLLWLGTSLAMAAQLRVQQALIETQRRDIGLWLKAHAGSPRDTVFVECLGYIGYYSGLKMLDYPGMASPEMVAARARHGEHWPALIHALAPDWIVLRPLELDQLRQEDPAALDGYRPAAVFDRSAAVAAHGSLWGLPYLQADQTFTVFRRVAAG